VGGEGTTDMISTKITVA